MTEVVGDEPSSEHTQGSADYQVALPLSFLIIVAASAQQHAKVDHGKAEDGPQQKSRFKG
jgi:hypothetical protein